MILKEFVKHVMSGDVAMDALKVSPPLGVVSSHIAGVNWPDVAYILTCVYTVIMIGQHIWSKWVKPSVENVEEE